MSATPTWRSGPISPAATASLSPVVHDLGGICCGFRNERSPERSSGRIFPRSWGWVSRSGRRFRRAPRPPSRSASSPTTSRAAENSAIRSTRDVMRASMSSRCSLTVPFDHAWRAAAIAGPRYCSKEKAAPRQSSLSSRNTPSSSSPRCESATMTNASNSSAAMCSRSAVAWTATPSYSSVRRSSIAPHRSPTADPAPLRPTMARGGPAQPLQASDRRRKSSWWRRRFSATTSWGVMWVTPTKGSTSCGRPAANNALENCNV